MNNQNPDASIVKGIVTAIDRRDVSGLKNILKDPKNIPSQISQDLILVRCFKCYLLGNMFINRFISILLEYNFNPNINLIQETNNYTPEFKSPLMLAVEKSDLTLVKILLSKSNVNLKDTFNRNCLFYFKGLQQDEEIIKLLVEQKIDINSRDNIENNTALHHAIIYEKSASLVSNFLKHTNIDLFSINNQGKTCIECIIDVFGDQKEILELMYGKISGNINCCNKGEIKEDEKDRKKNIDDEKLMNCLIDKENIKNNNDIMFKFVGKIGCKNENIDQNTCSNGNVKESKEIKNNNEIVGTTNFYLKMKPKKTLICYPCFNCNNNGLISSNEDNDYTNEEAKLEMKIKQIYSINGNKLKYYNILKDINKKKYNENINFRSKIMELKKTIAQQKAYLTELTNTFNTNFFNHQEKLKALQSNYNKTLAEMQNLKNQLRISKNNTFSFYSQEQSDSDSTTSASNNPNVNLNINLSSLASNVAGLQSINNNTLINTSLQSISTTPIMNQPLISTNQYSKFSEKSNYSEEYIITQLQYDLTDFSNYVSNSINNSEPMYNELINLIDTLVKESLGNDYNIKIYGSHATKLCLPKSDIDIIVSGPCFNSYTPLYSLSQYVLGKKVFKNVNYIGNTSVPLIKILTNDNFNNISIDISLEDNKHFGLQCVKYINNLLQKYEILKPMTLAIKNILYCASLNDPYKGGLSSYGVILLIYNFIIIQQNNGVDISINNIGKIFYDFLYYYGSVFDPANGIIDVNNRNDINNQCPFYKNNTGLVIVDPLDIQNNVGKNTRQFNNIKLAFMIGYMCAKESCNCGCHYQNNNFWVNEEGIEHCLLKRIFSAVKRIISDDRK